MATTQIETDTFPLVEHAARPPSEAVPLAGVEQYGHPGMWSRAYLAMFVLYVAIGMALRAGGWVHGDSAWFAEAARRVLDGSFDLYSYRDVAGVVPPLGATYAYSPLTAIIMAPFVGAADALGWGEQGAEWLLALPLLVIDALAVQQLVGLVRSWRPGVDERHLFAGVFVSLFLTGFLAVSGYYAHNDGLMLLFVLLALRLTPVSLPLGGLFAGLALAAKHTTILDLVPVGLVLLAGGRASRRGRSGGSGLAAVRDAVIWGGIAVGVFAAFMLVPAVRYPDQVYYAFVTQVALLIPFGPGLPVWLDRALEQIIAPAGYAGVRAGLLQYSNWVLVGAIALASAFVVWRHARRGQPVRPVDSRLLALVAFAAVAQLVLGKWVSGHYYQLPLALVFLWDIVRRTPYVDSQGTLRTPLLDPLPWIGLGAAVAFRSITQFGVWWFKDAALMLFFAGLMALLFVEAGRGADPEGLTTE